MKNLFRRTLLRGGLLAALVAPAVFAALPQSVTITAPAANANVSVASTSPSITFTANAVSSSSTTATISSIDFRVNGVSIGSLVGGTANTTQTIQWQPTATGTYTLTAIAADSSASSGNTLTSSPVTVTVTSTRFATVVAPSANSTVTQNSQIVLRSTASMSDGIVQKVEFILDPTGAATVVGTATTSPYNAAYTVNATVGAHTILARATASDGTTTFDSATVSFNVVAPVGTAPTVSISAPSNNSFVATGAATTITATAASTNTGGFIQSVTFYADGEPISTDTTAPFSASWTPTTAKAYSIRALATDDKGNTTLSSAVTVTASASLPTVSITSPANNSSATVNAATTITATATASTGATVTQVAFFANGTAVNPAATTAPYSVSWTPATTGAFSLTAQVTDSANVVATSSAVTVNVQSAVPAVSITAPTAGTTTTVGTATTVSATATASTGLSITQVEFFANGVSIAVDTTIPYSVVWTPSSAGAVNLTAVATQTGSVTTTSAAVAVTVNGAAPTIAITSPAAAASVPVNTATTITATATASTGATISQVVFFAAGVQIGSAVTTAPYSIAWTPSATGVVSLTARVTDSTGQSVTSSAVSVTVATAVPTVSLTAPAAGANIGLGAATTLTATAAATGGATVSRVDFLAGATTIATVLTAPYTTTWTPTVTGITALTARVTDSNGTTVTSSAVNVNVLGPTVALTAPANLAIVATNSSVSLTATASAVAPATVSRVDFFAGSTLVGSATSAPYTITWTASPSGSVSITARVVDSNGIAVTSSSVTVTVSTSAPTVTLTAPASGANVTLGASTTLTATAAATGGATVSRVDFLAGTTTIATVLTAPYTTTWTPSATGITALTARVTDSNGTVVTSSAVNVNVLGPTVTLTSPANLAVLTVNSATNLTATASAIAPATVSRVDFFAGSTLVGSANASPYTVSWTPTSAGSFSLTARVVDSNGIATTSTAVAVTVGSGPTVALTAPINGATVSGGTSVTLTAIANTSGSATITKVEFLVGGSLVGTATTSPYTFSWTAPSTAGTSSITARAVDSVGNSTTSSAVSVTVGTSPVPAVTVTAPTAGASVILGSNVTVTAGASATAPATVARVEFYADGTLFNIDFTAPYSVNYVPSQLGFLTFTAKVIDSAGNGITSSAVTVNVTQSNPAAVTLAAVPTSLVIPVGSSRLLNTTTTTDGAVTKVEFYLDGTLFETDTTTPFSITFTAPNLVGPHSLTARMYDTLGQVATSNPLAINITAANGSPPLAGISAPASGAFLAAGSTTTISGVATDPDGTVSTVQVFVNGVSLGNATLGTGGTWFVNWTPTVIGTASIIAVATDDRGNNAASPALSVNVTDTSAPVISVSATPGSTTLPSGATRNLLATVTPATGRAIVRVEFFVNGTKVSEKTAAPYSYRFAAPAATGTYVVSARATDNTALARDTAVTFTVIPPVGQPPTVNLLTPTNNTSITLANPTPPLNLAASALAATGGSINSVQFYQNGVPVGGAISPPTTFTTTFTPTAPGNYVFDAIATDDRGNTTVSNSSTVTAAFGTPTVAITSPNPNATTRLTPNVPVTISASAQGGSGAAVLLVEFLLDDVQIGTRTIGVTTGLNTIYSFSWTPTTAQLGAHKLTARVTDTNSLTATSPIAANINIATITGTPPAISIASPGNGANIQSVSTVNFIANAFASGANNNITSVEFFLNDVSTGTAAREQTTNLYRLSYSFAAYDFSNVTPDSSGRYPLTLYAIAKDTNGNQTLSSTINLFINTAQSLAPSVTLQALGGGIGGTNTVTQGTAFFMGAIPTDPDGTVTALQLFANGAASGGAIGSPSPLGTVVTFTPSAAGRYNLFVVATDDTGNTAVSSPAIVLNVTAINPPTTAITRPGDNSTVTTVNAPVFLEGTASGSDPTQIPTLQFLVTASTGARAATITGSRIGTTSTYRAIWTPNTADTYTITTQASVGSAQANSTASRRVVVNNVVGIAPVISGISFNPSQTTFTSASTANFSVTATDADGAVQSVEFFLNRNSIGQAVRDQLTNVWRLSGSFAGLTVNTSYELVAIASDSSGNVTASSTTNISVSNATSAPPSLSIVATPGTVAFSQAAQLTALASDPDGAVSSVQYFVNGSSVGTSSNASSSYQVNWTSSTSGTFNVYALATDNTGNTAISPTVQVTVKRNNPILDNDAFVLQTFQDIVARSPNSAELTLYGGMISSGALTRAGLINTLLQTTATNTAFTQTVNALATYYVIMGQWPTTANYTTIFNLRGSTSNVAGNVIASSDYILRYPERVTPTVALLNNPLSAIPVKTFLDRLWTNAGARPDNVDVDLIRFMNNNNSATNTLGRGYNVVGLPTAIAEFVTNTNASNTALFNSARAAAMFFMLSKPQVLADTTNALAGSMNVAQLTARITTLAPQVVATDLTPVAETCITDVLYSYRYVTITKHPQPLTVNARSGAIFSVEASGQPPLSYRWLLNGAPIAGNTTALTPRLTVTNVDGTKTGTYSVAVTSGANVSATSDPAVLQLTTTPTRVANLSTRGVTNAGGQYLIGGFVVSGTGNQTRQMLIRVVGPTLAAGGVAGFLADPRLEVYSAANRNAPILVNDNWGSQTGGQQAVNAIQQAAQRVGAFQLPNNSLDAAVLATLTPGLYTVQAQAQANVTTPGIVLIEAYDVTPNVTLTTPKPVNVSTRGPVGTGASVMIAGFVIDGAASRRILIRGAGPTLAQFAVPGVLADPQLELFNSAGVSLVKNDNWAAGDDAAQIAAASTAAGAFPLGNASRDSAMLLMLAPGAYTVHLSGVNNTTGVAIVEVYDVDP